MRELGRYVLSTRLSTGALGALFLARPKDEEGVTVVVKRVHAQVGGLQLNRLLNMEAAAGIAFSHPAAVPLLEVGTSNDAMYLVSPWVPGQPLSDVLRRARVSGAPLPQAVVAWIGAEVAGALAAAHQTPWFDGASAPLVHGAVSPRAILISYDGQVELAGMGYGRARAKIEPSGPRLPYAAPEVLAGREIGPRTDVYGLAVTLHDGLLGRAVYRRPSPDATRAAVRAGNAPPLAPRGLDLDPAIADLLQSMMAPRVEARPTNMVEIEQTLRAAAGDASGFPALLADRLETLFAEEREGMQRRLGAAARATQRRQRRAAGMDPETPSSPPTSSPPASTSNPPSPSAADTLPDTPAPAPTPPPSAEAQEAAPSPSSASMIPTPSAASVAAVSWSTAVAEAEMPTAPESGDVPLTRPGRAATPAVAFEAPVMAPAEPSAPPAAAPSEPPAAASEPPAPAPSEPPAAASEPPAVASEPPAPSEPPAAAPSEPPAVASEPPAAASAPPAPSEPPAAAPSEPPAVASEPPAVASEPPAPSEPPAVASEPPAPEPSEPPAPEPSEPPAPAPAPADLDIPVLPEVEADSGAPSPEPAVPSMWVTGDSFSPESDAALSEPWSHSSPAHGVDVVELPGEMPSLPARRVLEPADSDEHAAPEPSAAAPSAPEPSAPEPSAPELTVPQPEVSAPEDEDEDDDDFEVVVDEPTPAPRSSSFAAAVLGLGPKRGSRPPEPSGPPPTPLEVPALVEPEDEPAPEPTEAPPEDPQRPFSGLLDQAAAAGLTDHLPEFEGVPIAPPDDVDFDVDVDVEVEDEPPAAPPRVPAARASAVIARVSATPAPAPEPEPEPAPAPAPEPTVEDFARDLAEDLASPSGPRAAGGAAAGGTLGRYRILHEAPGSPPRRRYLARDPALARDVWLEVLRPGDVASAERPARAWVDRFVGEARALSQVRHPRLPAVFDVGREGGAHFIARAPVHGAPLATQARWPEEALGAVVRDLADALEALHEAQLCAGGLRSRDAWRDEEGRTTLVDLPRLFRLDGPPPAELLEAQDVLPPEFTEGAPFDRAGDLFSLGLLAHRLLTGASALPDAPEARARALRGGQIAVPSVENPALQEVLRRLLAPAPRARFARAADVSAALGAEGRREGPHLGPAAHEARADVILVDPDVTPAQARRILQARGVRAAVFSGIDNALAELPRLGARSVVVARSVDVDGDELRRRVRALDSRTDVRFVPAAASRMVGPPLSLEGLADAWLTLAPRVLALTPPETGFLPTTAARAMAQHLSLGLRTELLASLAAAARLLARRLGESPAKLPVDLPEEVPDILEAVERVDAGTSMIDDARPAARVVAVADAFYRSTRLDGLAPSRTLAELERRFTGPIARRLLDALIVHLRDLYATGDLAPPAADAPRVLLARRARAPALIKMLEFDGFQVEEAEDGEEAWELLRTIKPDVAILDVDLAGRDGASLVELSRVHPAMGEIEFLLLAAKDDDALRARLATLPRLQVVDRGASVEALRARVSALIE